MSRPFRFLFPAVIIASALSFAGCVGTIYDRTYSYKKTYFKSDVEDKKEASAETILGALNTTPGSTGAEGAAPATDVPGLPAAGLPAPDAGAAPAVPGLPPVPPAN